MPDKPTWYGQLEEAIVHLRDMPSQWVDRPVVEQLLRVGRRRAQQILKPCATKRIGASLVADREHLISHLQGLAIGEPATYEVARRRQVARTLESLHRSAVSNTHVLVEAPNQVLGTRLNNLPPGVTLGPGEIRVMFDTPQQALERLLALAMAIGNDYETFTHLAST